MPCYYTGSAEGDRELARHEAREANNKDSELLITKLTSMLCFLCEKIENGETVSWVNIEDSENKTIVDFWTEHKLRDKKRKEEIRKKALIRLSKEFTQEEIDLMSLKSI